MDTFTVRDLRERTGDLIRDAEAGRLSVVTKHGQPVFVAVPFDEMLVREGVRVALAVKLFQDGVSTLGKAAKLASMPQSEFINHLCALGIPVAQYGKEELEAEVAAFK